MQGLVLAGWAGPEEKRPYEQMTSPLHYKRYKEGDVCGKFLLRFCRSWIWIVWHGELRKAIDK